MRALPLPAAVCAALWLCLWSPMLHAGEYDLLVYGATPAGISAALVAGRSGNRVLLVEPGNRIGGMLTRGSAHPGLTSLEGRSGRYLEFTRRVESLYASRHGPDSPEVRASWKGCVGEPSVHLEVFETLLRETPGIELRTLWSLEALKCSSNAPQEQADPERSAEVAVFLDESGTRQQVAAHYFIDATYEGDLLAAARVPYRVGREAAAEFSESLAPEAADDQLQASHFQPVLTRVPENRLGVQAPKGYRRDEFTGLLPLLRDGRIRRPFGSGPDAAMQTAPVPLPNGKWVLTDSAAGLVRLSLPGTNAAWPDGDGGVAIRGGVERETLVAPFSRLGLSMPRERIRAVHRRWTLGLLFFIQNDAAVPAAFRAEALDWGPAADEFRDSVHFPEEMLVREARRMVGRRIFTQQDTEPAVGDARTAFSGESVAVSEAPLSAHFTALEGSRFGGKVTGGLEVVAPPVQIPLGILMPRHVDNLLVVCAVSASHVGFSILNTEPVRMSLGEAAGHVVHLANAAKRSVRRVPAAGVRRRLHAGGAATVYVSDVPPGSPDFEAVQWWGSVGGFHGLEPARDADSRRGVPLPDGAPFFAAFPGHAAEPGSVLTEDLAGRWALMAQAAGIPAAELPRADGKLTRGAWIRAAHRLSATLPAAD